MTEQLEESPGSGDRLDRLHPRVRRSDPRWVAVGPAAAGYGVLGTDGFGRSDYRKALRSFFEVDRHHVAVAALKALADDGVIDADSSVAEAIKRYEIDPAAPMPDDRMSATAERSQVTVPDIGDFSDVPVIEILVAVGDTVAVEDPLVTLESDKATMDVPSPAAGVVKAIQVKVGDSVSEGALLLDARVRLTATAIAAAPATTRPMTLPRRRSDRGASADKQRRAAAGRSRRRHLRRTA